MPLSYLIEYREGEEHQEGVEELLVVEEEHQEEGKEHQEEEEGPLVVEEEELLVVEEEGEGLELEDARLQPKVSQLEWVGLQKEMKEAMKREGEGLKKKESLETWTQQEEYHFLLPFYDFLRPQ